MRIATCILFLGAVLLLSNCNKVERNARILDGEWTIYSYTQISSGGFYTSYETEGTVTFDNQGEGFFSYSDDYTFISDTGSVQSQRIGSGTLTDKKGLSFMIDFSAPTLNPENEGSIQAISKDALKIRFTENGIGHLFVLQKQ